MAPIQKNVRPIEFVNDLLDRDQSHPAVLYFRTASAEQCKVMDGVVQELASAYPNVGFWLIDVEAFPDLAARHAIKAVPAFLAMAPPAADGNLVDAVSPGDSSTRGRVQGVRPADLALLVKSLSAAAPTGLPPGAAPVEDIDARCRRLISSHPLMLFIKGSPGAPRCGFTGQLLQLLGSAGLTGPWMGHYDILQDETVRQHLKVLSQWPTYPQVYHRGVLLGGLDILREMAASGALAAVKADLEGPTDR